jgi:hypothetical protein
MSSALSGEHDPAQAPAEAGPRRQDGSISGFGSLTEYRHPANNHYAGFGPGTINIFRNMLGLPEAKWEEKEEGKEEQQQQKAIPCS